MPLSRSSNKDLFIYLFKKKHNDTNPWQIHYYIYRQLTHFDEVNSINILHLVNFNLDNIFNFLCFHWVMGRRKLSSSYPRYGVG